MTLRTVKSEQGTTAESAATVQDAIKVTKFLQVVGDTMEYLVHGMCFVSSDESRTIGIPLVLIEDVTKHPYLNALYNEWYDEDKPRRRSSLFPHNERRITSNWWSQFEMKDKNNLEKLKNLIENIRHQGKMQLWDKGIFGDDGMAATTQLRQIIIFWNLFFVAMDDDLYERQLSAVVDLAQCFGFDEPMMRDWCRAVEYVFAGNKLSEDCDLHCETVEGAKFFLHKDE